MSAKARVSVVECLFEVPVLVQSPWWTWQTMWTPGTPGTTSRLADSMSFGLVASCVAWTVRGVA